jgi:hypothetical protein
MSFAETEHSSEDVSIEPKLKGMIVCDCWCHESGSKEDLCTKCLSRIGERKEYLSN